MTITEEFLILAISIVIVSIMWASCGLVLAMIISQLLIRWDIKQYEKRKKENEGKRGKEVQDL